MKQRWQDARHAPVTRTLGTDHGSDIVRPNVTILLATYNGERFLQEQLASLQAQTYREWHLWIRDDGSTDGTVDVLRRAANGDPRVHLLEPDGRRLGSTRNFGMLLESAVKDASARYIMFCDQDDVWRLDKIEATLRVMQRVEAECRQGTPVLVFTDFSFVDEHLAVLGSLERVAKRLSSPEGRILNSLLSQNFIYGCTMMLNRSLAEACVPLPDAAEQHDYWVALVAAAVGRVIHLRERAVLYRQHDSNETPGLSAATFSRRLRRLMFEGNDTARINRERCLQAEALAHHLKGRLPAEKQDLLTGYLAAMKQGGTAAAWFACRNGLRRQGILQTARYVLSLIATKPGPGHSEPAHARSNRR